MPSYPHLFDNATQALPDGPVVLAFGDSLTAGYGLQREEAFPARLQALLRASCRRYDAGPTSRSSSLVPMT